MSFNSLLLIWFKENKRDLPWRSSKNPYSVWLSEIILQQTRVNQGMSYYLKFMQKYPTVHDLAKANEQDVLKLWQGLGYYSRARNLHFTAKMIVDELDGNFPKNFKELKKLKGVGDYTAAAIASICYDEVVPVVDGNVFRVFSRYFNIDLDIALGKTKKYFFEVGEKVIDESSPGDFNQAVMELGALVCLPKNPKCDICPVNESCEGLKQQTYLKLPVKSKKIKVKKRTFHFIDFVCDKNRLLVKRTQKDVWQNLYTFPMWELSEEAFLKTIEELGLSQKPVKEETSIHVLTHQKININFWELKINKTQVKKLSKNLNAIEVESSKVISYPMPKPMENFLMNES